MFELWAMEMTCQIQTLFLIYHFLDILGAEVNELLNQRTTSSDDNGYDVPVIKESEFET